MPTSLYESAKAATRIFRTFEGGDPDLVDLGIPAVRRTIGGVGPGNLVGIGAGQNVGKSSFVLSMATNSLHTGGVISMEDGPDVWGARLLARYSDVGPTKIRRKDFSEADEAALQESLKLMERRSEEGAGPWIEYKVGGSVDDIEEAVEGLASAGCRWVVLDYLQKARGHHAERRSEVGVTLNRFHKACAQRDIVPVIMSQIVRLAPGREPYPGHMKESGDIENECRLILMLWRDASDDSILRCKVAKSSFGGGGLRFEYEYTDAEYLVERDPFADDEEGF